MLAVTKYVDSLFGRAVILNVLWVLYMCIVGSCKVLSSNCAALYIFCNVLILGSQK